MRYSKMPGSVSSTMETSAQFDSGPQQNHALFLAYDLLNDPKWELNIGAGFGLTPSTDPFVFKIITGRRVKWKK